MSWVNKNVNEEFLLCCQVVLDLISFMKFSVRLIVKGFHGGDLKMMNYVKQLTRIL